MSSFRRCTVLFFGKTVGEIVENEDGYTFAYSGEYLADADARAISVTLPLREEPFCTKTLHPFFDGLIPEGWTLDIITKNWKIDPRDRMGLLSACCRDCVGAVSIISGEAE
ncbi:HipA N-terminal domain-containing protein [Cloacibacillus sp. An23]|uniref:HipA N-terminal domain-containing protein n=1 Tax=Cloacibacillus sp. An23 TaxID=1965591 RepID=UPI000B3A870C|nr:HipA N-terminal domain-containing protein [Cloacibacillus sp. An23]OUO90237.1 phosphatidylinositol kinase [Cloacibacillus sp. An23]